MSISNLWGRAKQKFNKPLSGEGIDIKVVALAEPGHVCLKFRRPDGTWSDGTHVITTPRQLAFQRLYP